MKCMFTTDLHGSKAKFDAFFARVREERPDCALYGGDILEHGLSGKRAEGFITDYFIRNIEDISKAQDTRFYVIMGNDDPREFERHLEDAHRKGLLSYIHGKTEKAGKFFITGYSYVPPTPFQLKDWEKYDVSRHVDPGCVPPERGYRTVEVENKEIKYGTIGGDLDRLAVNSRPELTIFLFHSPPHDTNLDRAHLDGKKVDHVPMDVHVGSIAIRRFILKYQPRVTLHGHIHESPRITGSWTDRLGKTRCLSASHDGNGLCVVRFDASKQEEAEREIIHLH